MENRLLSFSEFESVYESYGFINEAEVAEKPTFTPDKLAVSSDDLLSLFGGDDKKQNEALKPSAFTLIKKGEKSQRVKELQKELGTEQNGVFDEVTEKKVKEFQTKNKLRYNRNLFKIYKLVHFFSFATLYADDITK